MEYQKINVIGVGYVGSIISLHLAQEGYEIIGVDKNEKVLSKEEWFSRYNDIDSHKEKKFLEKIKTTTDYQDLEGEVSILCVNTPVGEESADLSNIKDALEDLAGKIEKGHTIIIRSTLPPGATKSELIPLIQEKSGLEYGEGFHFCYAPEFVRGGTGLKDLKNPSKTVISGDKRGKEIFKQILPTLENTHETTIETAEATKCFDNAFHGLKISLANETGRMGREIGFNPNKVMEIISSDYKLNISDTYMSPGNAYGGPCLEKDIEILNNQARNSGTKTPVLSSINESNTYHNSWLVDKIKEIDPETVGLIGATFKDGFNSSKNSPCLDLASKLKKEGYNTLVYDSQIEIEGFKQTDLSEIAEADIWIIFNEKDSISELREDFSGNIIDLSNFEFHTK